MPATLSDYRWLTGEAARPWLERATLEAESTPLVTLSARLRRDLTSARTHLILEQVALRKRAAAKFSRAAEMFFAPIPLEQATGESISRYKAGRFPAAGEAADLCCGIGGDAIGLALRCARVRVVERRPELALLAHANITRYLEASGRPADRVRVEVGEVAEFDGRSAAWHADPDRRARGKRAASVAAADPPPEVLDRLLARLPAAAIKLAPAARLPAVWAECAECEWISHRGECRQLVAWFGALAQGAAARTATVLLDDQDARHIVGTGDSAPIEADRIDRYLYEPDAAVLAAGLTGTLADELGLRALAGPHGYLTGDRPVIDPALAGFEVLDVLPFQFKRLTAYCRQRTIGRVEVKKRGVSCDPLLLQRRLAGGGDNAVTLLICRHDRQTVVIAARRIGPRDAPTDAAINTA